MSKNLVIFDLDGTLADITLRRELSTDSTNGKMDWDIFFDSNNIGLDQPNTPVIKMAQLLKSQGYTIVIFSGRSKKTKDATRVWLDKYNVPFDVLKMRPTSDEWHYMKDSDLKQHWLDDLQIKDDVFAVFDDRQQVVDMWRQNGLTCFQVAEGDF
jgi:phosphoglycolate phosphatase-like HAD superfamily hydrolase